MCVCVDATLLIMTEVITSARTLSRFTFAQFKLMDGHKHGQEQRQGRGSGIGTATRRCEHASYISITL